MVSSWQNFYTWVPYGTVHDPRDNFSILEQISNTTHINWESTIETKYFHLISCVLQSICECYFWIEKSIATSIDTVIVHCKFQWIHRTWKSMPAWMFEGNDPYSGSNPIATTHFFQELFVPVHIQVRTNICTVINLIILKKKATLSFYIHVQLLRMTILRIKLLASW